MIYFQNMGGVRTKSDDICLRSAVSEFDIIIFVETWLNSNFFDSEFFDLKLFNVFRKDRDINKTGLSRGGGVLIAVRRYLSAFYVSLSNNDSILDQLCICIKDYSSKCSLYLLASYIPPGSSFDIYRSHTDNISSLVHNQLANNHLCVFGDFNLPNIIWSNNLSKFGLLPMRVNSKIDSYVVDNILSLNLTQINYFQNILNRILDLIFVSDNIDFNISKCLSPFSPTDKHHISLVLKLNFYEFATSTYNEKLAFNYNNCEFTRVDNSLLEVNWDILFADSDVAQCFSIFKSKVIEICRVYIPLIKKRQYKLPWFTRELKRLKNKRNKLFKKFKINKTEEAYVMYQHYLKKFNCLNKFLYNNYILSVETNIKSNPKSFWQYIKSKKSSSSVPSAVFLDDKLASTPSEVVNLFADFFKANFASEEPGSNWVCPLDATASLNFGCLSLSLEDVEKGILALKPSAKTDVDGLSVALFKRCSSLAFPLKLIFNKSLSSGIFIDEWKMTVVTPIFKSGKKNDVRNYRPISKLSSVSKLFENIVKEKMYFATKSIISPYQHGFITGRSTVSNLAVFTEYCIAAFSAGQQVDCIYTDLSKAFDKVSHSILLDKLLFLGFHSVFLDWLRSYLCNRHCVVSVDGASSAPFYASSGVPQGSILGPLLFVLFINDICSCFSFANFLLYADDLKIYSTISNSRDLHKLQADINRLVNWCSVSRLSLNIKKCFKLTYSKISNIIPTSYNIGDDILQSVEEIKDLGVVFDARFTFLNHIDFVLTKAYSMLGFIRRNSSNFADPYTLKLLFTSFVRSTLEYAVFIWRPYYQFSIDRIERVQKVFLKYALSSLNFSDPVPSYKSRLLLINLKQLESRRSILSLSFLFNIIKGEIDCSSLLEMINFSVPTRSLRNQYPFYLNRFRTNYACNAPIARSLHELNEISDSIELDFALSKLSFSAQLNCVF